MLKFFKRIRRKLIGEGNLKRYLMYAFGEILLVMIGILLALKVNNWNENQKSNRQKNQLVKDLLVELNNTNSKIESTITLAEAKANACNLYFSLLTSKDYSESADSLSKLLDEILAGAPYDLELPSYQEAQSTGKMNLLNSKDILYGYSNLLTAAQGFKLHRTVGLEMWYKGPMWEMRSKVGGRTVLTDRDSNLPENLRLSDQAYLSFLTQASTYAAIENSCYMNLNMKDYLQRMSNSAKDLIKLLEEK